MSSLDCQFFDRVSRQCFPNPPYYAVIFSSRLRDHQNSQEASDYAAIADQMMVLASVQPGFLGVDSARSDIGLTVSYWQDETSIAAWRAHAEHHIARAMGKARWYSAFSVRVARVERQYGWGMT